MNNTKINNQIEHVVFCLDSSGSMNHIEYSVVKVFDNEIQRLARRSKELDIEYRVSCFTFGSSFKCLFYDKDVFRVPKIGGYYRAQEGSTALIDGTINSLDDMAKTPEQYGDHSWLFYVLTDGEENSSKRKAADLSTRLGKIADNVTVAVFVPDQRGVAEAKRFGFAKDNIQVWDTSAKGIEEVGRVIERASEQHLKNRAVGIRSTKSLFTLNDNLSTTDVKKKLNVLDPTKYLLLHVRTAKEAIKPFVESWTKKPYVTGSSYYLLTKPEKIQPTKNILVQDSLNGKVYYGQEAREMLGLPDYEVKVEPANFKGLELFVQSTSTNRNLFQGNKVIVMV